MTIRNWYKSKLFPGLEAMVCHRPEEVEIIQKAVADFQPEIIIEFGTALAGLTLALHEAKKDVLLYTFDDAFPICSKKTMSKQLAWKHGDVIAYQRNLIRRTFDLAKVHFITTNILPGPNLLIVDILRRPVKKFLYCDNGNKVREVNCYAQYLRIGDMLGVHDWAAPDKHGANFERCPILSRHFNPVKLKYFDRDVSEAGVRNLKTRLFIKTSVTSAGST